MIVQRKAYVGYSSILKKLGKDLIEDKRVPVGFKVKDVFGDKHPIYHDCFGIK
jgi:hypothetical protein